MESKFSLHAGGGACLSYQGIFNAVAWPSSAVPDGRSRTQDRTSLLCYQKRACGCSSAVASAGA